MIYDGLISTELPSTLGPTLETGLAEGLARLLFEGRWARRRAECSLSGGAVLAGCYRALRGLGPRELSLRDDAAELLSLSAPAEGWGAPPPWAERLPPSWTTEPCAFSLRARLLPPEARWEGAAIRAVLRLRYAPRHDPEVGALVGGLRVLWTIGPEEGEDAARRLALTLAADEDLEAVADGLAAWGEQLSRQLAEGLEGALEGARVSRRGRVVVLWGERGRFGELLDGFEPEDQRALDALRERAAQSRRSRSAIGPDGAEGLLRRGRFVAAVRGVRDAG